MTAESRYQRNRNNREVTGSRQRVEVTMNTKATVISVVFSALGITPIIPFKA